MSTSTKIESVKTSKHLGSLLILSTLVAIGSQAFVAAPAKADCEYQGKMYSPGTVIGPYICMPDSTWQRND